MTLNLAENGGRGISGELKAALRLEAVDCLDEADGAYLHEIVERLAAVCELRGKKTHKVEMVDDELVTRRHVALVLVSGEELTGTLLVPGELVGSP